MPRETDSIKRRWWQFWKPKLEEYYGVREWIGEEFCVVCNQMIYEHDSNTVNKCVQKVKDGFRL